MEQKLSHEDFLNEFMKTQMYEILDNESFNNVCFTYRITSKLAGNSYRIAINKKLPEELKKFLFLHEAGHIYCRHNSLKTTLDYQFTVPKIKAVYERLKPLFDGQNIEEMYDIFEDYILNMIRDWEVNTKFFTEEEIRYWDTLYPEECCSGGPVEHMLPQDVGYEPGLSANEYLLCILQDPEKWFKNIVQQGSNKKNKKHKNGTEGGCNTNQQTPPSENNDYDADNDKNHNKEDREKQQQNQQNGQNGNSQNQQQSNQNGNSQNQQNNQSKQKSEGTDEQNQQAANENKPQEWKDEKNNKEAEENNGNNNGETELDNKSETDKSNKSSTEEAGDSDMADKESSKSSKGNGEDGSKDGEELTKEELQEFLKKLVKKMVSDYQHQQESLAQEKATKAEESSNYSRSSSGKDSGIALNDGVTNWSDYDNLEKQIRELLINRTSTVTKRDLLYNYNRGRFSSDVCVPRYRSETTYDEVPMTVLLDVSGSISQSDILGFCNIFNNVAKSMSKKCTIVLWDTELRAVFDSNDEIQAISGGGTNIGKGIRWISDNMQPDKVGNLFVVSDCCDELSEWLDSYKRTKYLVCWSDMNTIKTYIESSLRSKFMGEFEKILCKNYEE